MSERPKQYISGRTLLSLFNKGKLNVPGGTGIPRVDTKTGGIVLEKPKKHFDWKIEDLDEFWNPDRGQPPEWD